MGGEKETRGCTIFGGWGSPPHGRGKELQVLNKRKPLWITPAWAGKSLARELLLIVSRDYPRVGGEKAQQAYFLIL